MITRRIPMRNASKSRVVRLAKYLEDKKSSSRVQDVTITGCYSPDVEGAALEMMAVQAENRQAKSDKTYHLIISFREGERPARDTITAIEKRLDMASTSVFPFCTAIQKTSICMLLSTRSIQKH